MLTLLTLSVQAQEQFTIKGKTGSAGAPGKAFLLYKNGRDIITDSAHLRNGAFEFTGNLKEPTLARLIVDHKGVGFAQTPQNADMIMMYLEKGIIHIQAVDSVKNAEITGSLINDDHARYEAFIAGATEENLRARQYAFIRANPDSYVSLYTLRASAVPVIDAPVIAPLFNGLSKRLQETVTGREFKALIDKKQALAIGKTAPDFTQNDVNDQPVSLTDFRGKYVLIDFWASWCVPCRAENPTLVAAYERYKEKGFDILGVSLDRPGKREDWLKAIEKDGLTWTNVSDLKFWENEVAVLFGIKSIPQNFLLNREGIIIATDLRGGSLLEKLDELFSSHP